MPSVNDLLKKHEPRVKGATKSKQRIERKGPTRPWQENLKEYASTEESLPRPAEKPSASPEEGSISASVDPQSEPLEQRSAAPEEASTAAMGSAASEQRPLSSDAVAQRATKDRSVSRKKVDSKRTAAEERESLNSPLAASSSRSAASAPAVSSGAAKMIRLISNNGFDVAMKFVLLCELANSDGLIQCSQQFLAAQLNVNLKSVKRLFDDLCDRRLIELAKESDPATKAPREYRILHR
jgi:hypothetical protein